MKKRNKSRSNSNLPSLRPLKDKRVKPLFNPPEKHYPLNSLLSLSVTYVLLKSKSASLIPRVIIFTLKRLMSESLRVLERLDLASRSLSH